MNPAGAPPVLEVKGLCKSFGGLEALSHVDLQLHPGEILGVIGPNGAGKTTLFNVISGIYRPTRGTVLVRGRPVTGLPPHRVALNGVARTFQNLKLFDGLSVLENVAAARLPTLGYGWRSPFLPRRVLVPELERAAELVAWVGLAGRERDPAGSLSYGQRKRLEIARALATDPVVLLLDEPCAGMNPTEAAELIGLLREVHRKGIAMMLVEHNMAVVMGLSHRVAVLNYGRKLAEGTPAEVQRNEAVIQAYLGRDDDDDAAG